jgi:CxxC motif-containing protein
LKDIKEILAPDTYQKIQTYMKIDMKFDNNKGIINNRYKSIDKGINDINLNLIKKNMAKLANHDSFKALIPKKKHSLKSQIPISNKNDYAMHFRVKQHFIKLTNSKKFIIKVKNEKDIKKVVCMKCKKSSLFSREDQNFIRCLNCGNVICKYCFKQLGEKNNNSIRKLNTIYAICYNHIKIRTKKSKPKRIIYEILFIISGFLILWIGFSKYEAKYIINKRKRYFLFVIFFFIFLMTNLVIFIFFIPYFPLIISILE